MLALCHDYSTERYKIANQRTGKNTKRNQTTQHYKTHEVNFMFSKLDRYNVGFMPKVQKSNE